MTHYKTKIVLDTFQELRRELKGKCGNSCPKFILNHSAKKRSNIFSFCEICKKEFSFIACKDLFYNCPCLRELNPEELFLRLDEFIEELKQKLLKEYSS